ncbi:unnamed protein product [Pedinophyceae sp. YPF-701]|nr:unnamed protein product [Pedinophyceae sp. YPF-701]
MEGNNSRAGTAPGAEAFIDTGAGNENAGSGEGGLVLFSMAKKETHTPKRGFRNLFRRLKTQFTVGRMTADDFSPERLSSAAILVLGCPTEEFLTSEVKMLQQFVSLGGSILVLLREGGEAAAGTNINYFLEEYGMSVNDDVVIRASHAKYLHPKEVLIADGVVNRAVVTCTARSRRKETARDADEDAPEDAPERDLTFVYPRGATVNVQKPAVPLLSTGKVSYPTRRPVAAAWQAPGGRGKIAVVGSADLLSDDWLDKEENSRVMDFLFRWMRPGDDVALDPMDADDPDVNPEKNVVPDITALAEKLKPALALGEDLPTDWTTMFDERLQTLHMGHVPDAAALYEKLGLKKELLGLVRPQFDTPLPALQPAVFDPILKEPAAPELELFDLDDEFSTESVKLAELTNKYASLSKGHTDEDVENYIKEAANILHLETPPGGERTAKTMLAQAFRMICEYKMS